MVATGASFRINLFSISIAVPANKENSDADFNLGAAFMAVQIFPTGVYVSMNGKSFKAAEVKKNLNTGYFETI